MTKDPFTDEEIEKLLEMLYQEHYLESKDDTEIARLIGGLERYMGC